MNTKMVIVSLFVALASPSTVPLLPPLHSVLMVCDPSNTRTSLFRVDYVHVEIFRASGNRCGESMQAYLGVDLGLGWTSFHSHWLVCIFMTVLLKSSLVVLLLLSFQYHNYYSYYYYCYYYDDDYYCDYGYS